MNNNHKGTLVIKAANGKHG